jgi:hypothetical protein
LVRGLAIGMLALSYGSASWAQESPELPESVLPAVRQTLRDTTSWIRIAPLRIGAIADVAVDLTRPEIVVTIGENGATWLTLDAGASWSRILEREVSGLSNDEDRLQQLDAYMQDAIDIMSADDLTDNLDIEEFDETALEDAIADRQQEIQQQIADEIRVDLDTQAFLFGDETQSGALGPRVSLTGGHDQIWVGRADGLWLSEDLGGSWDHVLEMATTRVVYSSERGVFVAGTADGFRYSVDPHAFIDAEDGTEGLLVLDIANAPEGLYAGTNDGLWYADTAQHWVPTGPSADVLPAIAIDPNWETGLWIATPTAVVRSDDRGRRFRQPLGAPLRGVRDLLHLDASRRLLAASEDGPWESLDGGTTWIPLARGLVSPDVTGIAGASTDSLYLASRDGLFKLVPREEEGVILASDGPIPTWIDPQILLREALYRPGVAGTDATRKIRGLNSALPQVRMDFRYNPDRDLRFTTSSGTTRGRDSMWQASLRLTWTPDGQKVASEVSGVVLDGDLVLVGADDQAVVAAKVGRRTVNYRRKVTDSVIDLFGARIELELSRPMLAGSSLADKVEHQLRVLEVESQLDALTDGYISRYNFANSEGANP